VQGRQLAARMQGNRGRRTAFVLIVLLVALGAFAATAYVMWRWRAKTIDHQLATAALTARALEDHLTQTFNVIERTLLNVAEEDRGTADLSFALRQAPYLRSIAITGKGGTVATSSTARNVGVRLMLTDFLPQTAEPVEVLRVGSLNAGRDFYDGRLSHLASPNPTISFIPVARDVRLDRSTWTTVVASVNTDYFLNFYSHHIPADEGLVQLLRYDGRLLLSTDEAERPGMLNSSDGVPARMAENEAGRFEESTENGRALLTAYRASRAYPFVLVVRLDKERALALWREDSANAFAIVGAILLAALALASLYFVRSERLTRDQARDQARLRVAATAFESQAGMVVTNARAVILQVNKAFTAITGYAAEEAVGQHMGFLQSDRHDTAFYATVRAAMEDTGTYAGEILIRHRDGTTHPHFLGLTAVTGDNGRISHFVGSLIDITERKQAEEEVRELNRDFVSFLENTTDFIYFKDGNGCFRFCSQALALITGHASWREIVGKRDLDVFPQDTAQAHYDDELQIFGTGRPLLNKIEAYQDAEGNRRWISTSRWPLSDHEGKVTGLFGISRDITQSMAYERELQQARISAEAANIAKSRFLASMSHEIRTPMNGILGMAQMFLIPGTTAEERENYARTILTSGQTLLRLLNDILDLSKIEAGKIALDHAAFAPAQLMQEIQALFAGPARDRSLELSCHWRTAPGQHYHSDAHRLRQMLSNLVDNALKFTAQGSVRIEGSEVERQGDSALLEFSVSDTGIGIPEEKIELLFKPFSQADNSTTREFGGTGLGLSIVKRLAKLIGGEVGVDSTAGKGSRFWFRIRADLVAAGAGSVAVADVPHARLATATASSHWRGHVLVVEDDVVNRRVIKAMLTRLGLRVSLKENGAEAVRFVITDERPDLVLMDLSMPVLDGCDATREIRRWEAAARLPRLPIIAFTAGAFDADRANSIAAGMDDFLTKPVDLDALNSLLPRWLCRTPETLPSTLTDAPRLEHQERLERLDTRQFALLVEDLVGLLDKHSFDAIARFKDLRPIVAGTAIAGDIDAIARLLDEFRFDMARERLLALASAQREKT
jgi:PAS domain S-box-containing protein